jgi:hypothetical protein
VTPEDEDVRMMQCEISNVLLAHGRRIRCGNDLATVRKVLGDVQTDVAEFLRASGAPGGEVCAESGGALPAEAGTTATPGASMSIAARAKMLAADDIAQGRVVGSRGAPGFLVRGATERRRARELEQDGAQRAGCLCQAEAPPSPSREHMEHLGATIAALTEARDWQQGKKEDAEAALRALQFKFDQLSEELARARATAADALARPAGAWSQMRAMARQVLVRHIEAGGAADPVCAGPSGEPITTVQMIERLDAGEDVSAFLDSLTGAALRLMRAELRNKEEVRK